MIRQRFTTLCASFEDLCDIVTPLLSRNKQLFDAYGPSDDGQHDDAKFALWKRFEPELIVNNEKLELLFRANEQLIHKENRDTIAAFIGHCQEFLATRDQAVGRIMLFPEELPAMFGIVEYAASKPPPNVNALQNLVRKLQEEEQFVNLQLEPNPELRYVEDGTEIVLSLMNRPYIQQLYWSRFCFGSGSTKLRLENLMFFLHWLRYQGISYEFHDFTDLTHLVVADCYHLSLFEEYCLSVAFLYNVAPQSNHIVVNLFDWNGGQITSEAREYAENAHFRVMTKKEFFAFAMANLR